MPATKTQVKNVQPNLNLVNYNFLIFCVKQCRYLQKIRTMAISESMRKSYAKKLC